jgi:glycosyl transferase family 25
VKNIGYQSMHSYVISLPRSSDRRAHIVRQLRWAGVSWEFVDGIDGRGVNVDDPSIVTTQAKAHPLFRPGKAGCALSHRSVYEKVLNSGEDAAVVLEDDVDLPEDFERLVETVAAEMHGAEVTLLNFRHPDGLKVSLESAIEVAGHRVIASPLNLEELTSGAAYVITRQACEQLAGAIVPMRSSSDEWWRFVTEGALEQVRCVVPMAVRQSLKFRTTIDNYPQGSVQWRLREAWSRLGCYRLPLVRGVIHHRRTRDFKRWGALGKFELVRAGPTASDLVEQVGPGPQTSQATRVRREGGSTDALEALH